MTSTMQVMICALLMTITALVHYIYVVNTDYHAQCIVIRHTASSAPSAQNTAQHSLRKSSFPGHLLLLCICNAA